MCVCVWTFTFTSHECAKACLSLKKSLHITLINRMQPGRRGNLKAGAGACVTGRHEGFYDDASDDDDDDDSDTDDDGDFIQ